VCDPVVALLHRESDWRDLYPLHCHAQIGDATTLRCLIDSTPSVGVNALDNDGWSQMHYAAWYGHTTVVQLILSHHAQVDVLNGQQATPLHFAAGGGRVDTVRV
jgi:ankyrin repeat protein